MPVAKSAVVILFFICLLAFHAGTSAAQSAEPRKQEMTLEAELERTFRMNYLLYLPDGYSESPKSWPLLLYLHGGKGRGNDLSKLAWYPVPRMLDEGTYDLPFVVAVPQCPEKEIWTDTEALIALLDDVQARYAIDPNRVYLVGYSMGGNGAWYLAYKYPERFAAVSPMSGPANTWWTSRLRDVPIWVFHGEKDEVVPARESIEMVDALRAKGGEVKFSLDPERGHSPPSTAEHLELFDWLLEHSKDEVGD